MSTNTNIVQTLVEKYGKKRESLLPILREIVKEERHLSEKRLFEVAEALDLSGAEVYGTASFYSFLDTKPRGKNIIRVCRTIVCDMKGKSEVLDTIYHCLGIKIGETTPDGLFTLLETNCLGQCDKAPAMMINENIYTELNNNKVEKILKEYKLNNKN